MDDASCRRSFTEPEQTFHRRYEALRAFFVEGQSLEATAAQFGYPGSKMVPASSALLSLLALKLLDKERHSHIDDFNFDPALGLFAGLNILPKKSFASDYSYRTQREHQEGLLQGWVKRLWPVMFPEANTFSLDFQALPPADPLLGGDGSPAR